MTETAFDEWMRTKKEIKQERIINKTQKPFLYYLTWMAIFLEGFVAVHLGTSYEHILTKTLAISIGLVLILLTWHYIKWTK